MKLLWQLGSCVDAAVAANHKPQVACRSSNSQARAVCAAVLCLAAAHAASQPAEQVVVVAPLVAAPSAGTVLGADAIARSGATSLGELLDALPPFGSQGVNGAQNDSGFGEYFVDLRNLNFDRTLVLVDGQRFVLSGIQTDEAVDLNDIPAAFVARIDIRADGTQPAEAPDAVAGSVNLTLKDDTQGVRLDAYRGAAGAGDTGTTETSLIAGQDIPDGHLAYGLDILSRAALPQADRGWAADPIATEMQTPTGPAIVFGSAAAPGGHAVAPGIDALALGGGRSRPFDPATDDFNLATDRTLQGALQRQTGYLIARRRLAAGITARVSLLYGDRRASNGQAPQILGLSGTDKHPDGFVIPASDPFNPFATPVTLERVVTQAGGQTTTTGGPVWRVTAGLAGALGSWAWDAGFDHGQSLSRYATDNAVNLSRALQTAGAAPCPAAAGCVAANWFGNDALSPAALRYITYTAHSGSAYAQSVGTAHLAGPLLALPGGAARLSLGAEMRHEQGATTIDAVTARGDQAGNDAAPTSGGYDISEASATFDLPLLRDLDVSLAGRATATSRYGAFVIGRAALDYAPLPGLHLRAVSGTARRPPAISEAFGGLTASELPVTDPCAQGAGARASPVVEANCRAQGLGPGFVQASPLIDVISGGDPSLRPEQSENELLAISYAPPLLHGLALRADWYQYRIRDAIDSLADTDPNAIPDACYASPDLSSPLCALITRIPGGGNAGQISAIVARDENVGTIKTSGIDLGLDLTRAAGSMGQVTLDWQTSWLLGYRLHTLGQRGFVDYAGTFPGLSEVGSYARIRSRATALLERGPWSVEWTGRAISGATVLGTTSRASTVVYQDIELTRQFGRLSAMAGIENLADVTPPVLLDGQTNTDTSTYDVVGRFIWGRLSYAF